MAGTPKPRRYALNPDAFSDDYPVTRSTPTPTPSKTDTTKKYTVQSLPKSTPRPKIETPVKRTTAVPTSTPSTVRTVQQQAKSIVDIEEYESRYGIYDWVGEDNLIYTYMDTLSPDAAEDLVTTCLAKLFTALENIIDPSSGNLVGRFKETIVRKFRNLESYSRTKFEELYNRAFGDVTDDETSNEKLGGFMSFIEKHVFREEDEKGVYRGKYIISPFYRDYVVRTTDQIITECHKQGICKWMAFDPLWFKYCIRTYLIVTKYFETGTEGTWADKEANVSDSPWSKAPGRHGERGMNQYMPGTITKMREKLNLPKYISGHMRWRTYIAIESDMMTWFAVDQLRILDSQYKLDSYTGPLDDGFYKEPGKLTGSTKIMWHKLRVTKELGMKMATMLTISHKLGAYSKGAGSKGAYNAVDLDNLRHLRVPALYEAMEEALRVMLDVGALEQIGDLEEGEVPRLIGGCDG